MLKWLLGAAGNRDGQAQALEPDALGREAAAQAAPASRRTNCVIVVPSRKLTAMTHAESAKTRNQR